MATGPKAIGASLPLPQRETGGPTAIHFAALIVAQLAIGSAAILARYGLDAKYSTAPLSPAALSAWRLSLASILLVAGLALTQRSTVVARASVPTNTRGRLIAAGIFLGLHFVLWFASLQMISVARSTLLVTSGPVWTGLGGWIFLKQKLGARFWTGLLVAGVGALLVTGKGAEAGHAALAGDLLAIAGAISVAVYLLMVQDLQSELGTGRTVAWTYTSAALAVWTWVLITELGRRSVIPTGAVAWWSVIGMALAPQLVGHTLLNWSLKRFAAGVVAAATLLEPVFAAALAWVLFQEAIRPLQAVGAVVLLAGVGLAIWTKRSR